MSRTFNTRLPSSWSNFQSRRMMRSAMARRALLVRRLKCPIMSPPLFSFHHHHQNTNAHHLLSFHTNWNKKGEGKCKHPFFLLVLVFTLACFLILCLFIAVLAGALLEQAETLLDKGLHPIRIADGFVHNTARDLVFGCVLCLCPHKSRVG